MSFKLTSGMLNERVEPRMQSKRHFIEGPDPSDVQARVDEIFREYPPEGYGTYIVSSEIDATTGVFRTVVWHANSAE